MLVVIVVLLFFMWTPTILWEISRSIYLVYWKTQPPGVNFKQFTAALQIISYVNSIVNAPVYFFTSE